MEMVGMKHLPLFFPFQSRIFIPARTIKRYPQVPVHPGLALARINAQAFGVIAGNGVWLTK